MTELDFIESLVSEFSVSINDISKITGLSNQIIEKKLKKKAPLFRLLYAMQNIFFKKKIVSHKKLTETERKIIFKHVQKRKYVVDEDGVRSFFFNNGKGQYCILIRSFHCFKYYRKQQLDSELDQLIVSNRMDSLSETELSLLEQKQQSSPNGDVDQIMDEVGKRHSSYEESLGDCFSAVENCEVAFAEVETGVGIDAFAGKEVHALVDDPESEQRISNAKENEVPIENEAQEIDDRPEPEPKISNDNEIEVSAVYEVREMEDGFDQEQWKPSEEKETYTESSDIALTEKFDGRYDDIIGIGIEDIDESDMQIRKSKHDQDSFRDKVQRVFDEHPLLGSYQLLDRDSNELLLRCSISMQKAMRGINLDMFENEMLCLFMINKIKKREHKDEQFWEYIFEQLGSKAIGSSDNQKAYHILTQALKKALKLNNRYFVNHGKKYYSTILAHAFSPETSLFALYDFLYHFYKDNLDWEFDENDEYTDKMFDILRKRMAGESNRESIRLSSKQYNIEIGLRILIIERPKFMLAFFKKCLRNLDLLLSVGSVEAENFEDACFIRWYQKSQENILNSKKGNQRKRRETVTRKENIECRYLLVDGKDAALSTPNIRFANEVIEQPYFVIKWGNDERRVALETYGNEFGFKIEEKTILLRSIFDNYKSHDSFDINTTIVAGEQLIYDSRETLFRKALCFKGEKENRIINCEQGDYVFCTTNNTSLIVTNSERSLIPNACDYTYYVSIGEGFVIEYNGEIMCVDKPDESFGCQTSIKPSDNSVFVFKDSEYSIFNDKFIIKVFLDESTSPKSIQIIDNGSTYSLASCNSRKFNSQILYELPIELNGFEMHRFKIIDNNTDRIVYMLNYVIIKDYYCIFDQPFYYRNAEGHFARMQLGKKLEAKLDGNIYQYVPYMDGDIRIKKPIVSWDIDGEILSGAVWYEKIPQGTEMNIVLPQETCASLIIGNTLSKSRNETGSLDIGNSIQSRNHNMRRFPVELEISNQYRNEQHKLFDVLYYPVFLDKPIFYVEGKVIKWNNAKFIGPDNANLLVSFSINRMEVLSCSLQTGNDTVSIAEIADDNYDYFIFIEPESIFSDRQLIDTGTCFLGDKNATRFKHKRIKINKIREMDSTATFFETYSIKEVYIERLSFIGMEDKFNNGVYPFYKGIAYYTHYKTGEKIYFSDKEVSEHTGMKYGLNPVFIHVVNDQFLIIGCKEDEFDDTQPPDGLYWDKSRGCITDYCSITGMKSADAVKRLGTPDFYFYKVEVDR